MLNKHLLDLHSQSLKLNSAGLVTSILVYDTGKSDLGEPCPSHQVLVSGACVLLPIFHISNQCALVLPPCPLGLPGSRLPDPQGSPAALAPSVGRASVHRSQKACQVLESHCPPNAPSGATKKLIQGHEQARDQLPCVCS